MSSFIIPQTPIISDIVVNIQTIKPLGPPKPISPIGTHEPSERCNDVETSNPAETLIDVEPYIDVKHCDIVETLNDVETNNLVETLVTMEIQKHDTETFKHVSKTKQCLEHKWLCEKHPSFMQNLLDALPKHPPKLKRQVCEPYIQGPPPSPCPACIDTDNETV
jgi:hypothetical protein